jgi:hypothetical protein
MCVLDSDPKGDKLLYWAAVVIRPRNALVQWISRGRVGSVAAAGESAPGRRGGGGELTAPFGYHDQRYQFLTQGVTPEKELSLSMRSFGYIGYFEY